MHLHLSFIHWLVTGIEVLLFLIPLKIIAANFVGRSSLADALYGVV
jgi:hypothetical protein